MSGQKLKASHKVAAFIERMLRDIRVRDMKIDIPASSEALSTSMSVSVIDGEVDIRGDLVDMDTGFGSKVSFMENLSVDGVTGISLDSFTGNCIDVEIESISYTGVQNQDLIMETSTSDYCDAESFRLRYKTNVKPVDFEGFSPEVKWVNPLIYNKIKENLFLIRKIKVRHSSVNMSFVNEKTQLKFWRKAVLTTKKDPKKLELKGFFYGVPVDSVEKMAYDGVRGVLLYSYNQNYRKTGSQSKDVAVFHDVEKNERVVIID